MNQDQPLSRREFVKLLGAVSLSYIAAANHLKTGRGGNPRQSSEKPNVLMLVFDTLSARHMSLHGYPRATTPNLARFAERAFVYHNHYAAGNFTSPGTASLLTGVYPWQHRAVNLNGIVSQTYIDQNIFSLVNASYHTAAYTHNPLAALFLNQFAEHIDQYHAMRELSLAGEVYSDRVGKSQFPVAFWSETMLRGTDHFLPASLLVSTLEKGIQNLRVRGIESSLREKYPRGIPYNYKGMHLLLEDAMDWIREQVLAYPQPYLAYYHLWPPHDPYLPSADYIDIFNDGMKWPEKAENFFSLHEPGATINQSRQQYDEYLAYVDFEFGRLVGMLERGGALDNTMLVVTSDHGELFERGLLGHLNSTLYQDLLRVPLLISLPKQAGRQDIYTPTSCIDLLPTILQITGEVVPDYIQGEVLPGFGIATRAAEPGVYAMEGKLSSKQDATRTCTLVMIKDRYKLIRYSGYESELEDELYDIENDPEEMENLANIKRSLSAEMAAELEARLEHDLGG